ncbi:MAG: hypothetical protein ABH859_06170 [Pseudomonadota bacterium]
MLAAHLAPALVAKSLRPSLNLPLAMVLCLLPDIVHSLLILLKIEKLHHDSRFSHTLILVFGLAVVTFLGSIFFHANFTNSCIYGFCVISHFLFDLVNRSQMKLTPWGGQMPGVGLHQKGATRFHNLAFFIEIFLVISSGIIYAISRLLPITILFLLLLSELGYYYIYAPVIENSLANWWQIKKN